MKKIATIFTVLFVLILTAQSQSVNLTLNPYADVDWATVNQYKGNYHTHTTNSDGSQAPSTVVEEYASKGYSILSITDHNYTTWPLDNSAMLAIKGNEYSGSHHMNAFVNFDISSASFETGIPHVQDMNGVSLVNHPGRYKSPSDWAWYIPWFRDYSTCVAIETFNQGDRYSGDRQLWDNINENLFAESGKLVWGVSNDDKHSIPHLYRNFNMMLMPELTEAAWVDCMYKGAFYFCTEPGGSGEARVPVITNIVNDDASKTITITATNYDSIQWIGPGTMVVARGGVFDYSSYSDQTFVRAILYGAEGNSYTQPFGFVFDLGTVPPLCDLTAPLDGTYYAEQQTITLSADATDTDGTIAEVEFFVTGNSVGTVHTAPFTMDYAVSADGAYSVYAIATDDFGVSTTSSTSTILVGFIADVVSSRIASSMDDVEEESNGTISTNSSDIELVDDGGIQTIGLRFAELNIPQGATITSASIQFTCDETNSGATNLVIKGQAADDAAPFTTAAYDVSSRTTTTASVSWSPEAWTTVNEAGAKQKTPDLSAVIQEIVDRAGFSTSSAISVIITGDGERTAEAYDGSQSGAALLTVAYTMGAGDGPSVGLALNPYADVDWSTVNQYKGNFHTHTTNSDGAQAPATVVDEYLSKGYDILSITDHNYTTWPQDISTMLAIKGNEYSGSHHMNAFVNFDNSSSNFEDGIPHVQEKNGISLVNHPGRYNSPSNWEWYIPWFRDYSTCVAIETYNQGDRYSNDRELWDNINENLFAEAGKLVWGVSNDDKHRPSHLYGNFNFMLMPELTEAAWVESMTKGAFYFCTEPGKSGEARVPRISDIVVDEVAKTITITATGYDNIEWIGPGSAVVAEGNVFDYSAYTGKAFVRAVLEGSEGDSYTQPFGFETNLRTLYPVCTITAPEEGTYYYESDSVKITADAIDYDGTIAGVEFFVDGISIGTDATAPYQASFVMETDSVLISAVATDNVGASATSSEIKAYMHPTGIFTVSSRIASSMDDVEERANGDMYTNSSDIELVYDSGGNQTIGLRFRDLNIPQGATITEANIQFNCDETKSVPTNLTIKGQAADAAAPFTTAAFDVSSRLTTNASVNWNPEAWTIVHEENEKQRTPDLSAIIQEIVDRAGFSTSSAINIIVTGDGERIAESYDGSSSQAALLTVTYTLEPRFELGVVTSDCQESKICMPLMVNDSLSMATGFDLTINYDTNKVSTNGKITVSNDLLNACYVNYLSNVVEEEGLVHISIYMGANTPDSLFFEGMGELFCMEFTKSDDFAAEVDTAVFEVSSLIVSYDAGPAKLAVKPGYYSATKPVTFTGKLKHWNGDDTISYSVTNPYDYLNINIYGADNACSVTSAATQPDMYGNFQHNLNEGLNIVIDGDIDNKTAVMEVINAQDALLTARTTVNADNLNAFQFMAMDVNLDGAVTAGDASRILQRSVNTLPEFIQVKEPKAKDWVFIDQTSTQTADIFTRSASFPGSDGLGFSKYMVPDAPACLALPVENFSTCPDIDTETFIGVMLGDVDGNLIAGENKVEVKSAGTGNHKSASSKLIYNLDEKDDNVNVYIGVKGAATESFNFKLAYNQDKLDVSEITDLVELTSAYQNAPGNEAVSYGAYDPNLGLINTADYLVRVSFNKQGAINTEDIAFELSIVNGTKTTAIQAEASGVETNQLIESKVYPNPATDEVIVEVPENTTIEVYSVVGELMEATVATTSTTKINVSEFPAGMYLVRMNYKQHSKTIKLSIE